MGEFVVVEDVLDISLSGFVVIIKIIGENSVINVFESDIYPSYHFPLIYWALSVFGAKLVPFDSLFYAISETGAVSEVKLSDSFSAVRITVRICSIFPG